jgi:hypothetical protein
MDVTDPPLVLTRPWRAHRILRCTGRPLLRGFCCHRVFLQARITDLLLPHITPEQFLWLQELALVTTPLRCGPLYCWVTPGGWSLGAAPSSLEAPSRRCVLATHARAAEIDHSERILNISRWLYNSYFEIFFGNCKLGELHHHPGAGGIHADRSSPFSSSACRAAAPEGKTRLEQKEARREGRPRTEHAPSTTATTSQAAEQNQNRETTKRPRTRKRRRTQRR